VWCAKSADGLREAAIKFAQNALCEENMLRRIPEHPSIIRLLHSGHPSPHVDTRGEDVGGDGHPLIMEYHRCGTLRSEMNSRQEPFDADIVELWCTQLLEVLCELLNADGRIVHRDIKPENLMIESTGRRLVLIDFGVSREFFMTGLMSLNGTPGYVPPELANAGVEWDWWSVGMVLAEVLSVQTPGDPEDRRRGVSRADVPARVRRVVAGLLEHDRKRRLSPEAALDLLRPTEGHASVDSISPPSPLCSVSPGPHTETTPTPPGEDRRQSMSPMPTGDPPIAVNC